MADREKEAKKRKKTPGRAWYAGKVPPELQMLTDAEGADESAQVLYASGGGEGEYADVVKGLYDAMDSLKRNPNDFRTWTEEDGMETFLEVLLDFAESETRARVRILQQVGAFKFRSVDGPDEKKAKIEAVFEDPQDLDQKDAISGQARKLNLIWAAKPDSLLDYVIGRPAQIGRALSERLNPADPGPLQLVGHPFDEVHSSLLQPLAASKTVAWERDSEIHVLTPVGRVLENWDQDTEATGGCDQVTLLDALLLHELVELSLHESDPDMDPISAHIVASTFERYLKNTLLTVAVEDFFLEWPPLSAAEIEERSAAELEAQLAGVNAFLGEEEIPDDDDAGLDDLPMDDAVPRKKKKKKVVKGKVVKGKVVKKKVVKKKIVKKKKQV